MDAQAAIIAARLNRVSELRNEVARLREENARLRAESEALVAHFDLALLAAADLAALPPTGRFLLVDGWNVILGEGVRVKGEGRESERCTVKGERLEPSSPRLLFAAEEKSRRVHNLSPFTFHCASSTPSALIARARDYLAEHPDDFVWIVFDGERENAFQEGRLRVSYTGGTGPQRADRFICDFLRMARWRGLSAPLVVVTSDKLLLREAKRLLK